MKFRRSKIKEKKINKRKMKQMIGRDKKSLPTKSLSISRRSKSLMRLF